MRFCLLSRRTRFTYRLAAAVADGEAIDWKEVERRSGSSQESSAAQGLRQLEVLTPERPLLKLDGRPELFGPWARTALFVLAGAQIALSIAAFFFGRVDVSVVLSRLLIFVTSVFAAAAALLLTMGSRDTRASALAGAFLGIATATAQRSLGNVDSIIPWLSSSWATAFLPEAFMPYFLWSFARDFPRLLRFSRWSAAIELFAKISLCIGIAFFVANAWARIFGLGDVVGLRMLGLLLRQARGGYWLVLSLLCLLALAVPVLRQRSAPHEERRRVRVFVSGLAIGVGPMFLQVLAETMIPALARWASIPRSKAMIAAILYAFLLTVPLTTTYSVLARRVLDLRVSLGLAARFALARGTLAVLSLLPIGALAGLAYRHRDVPLTMALGGPVAPWLVAASALGVVLFVFRSPFSKWTERRLLGREVEASAALLEFGRAAQRCGNLLVLVQILRRHLSAFLRCDQVVWLRREPGGATFVDVERWSAPLSADSSIVSLAETSPEPLNVDPEANVSLFSWLLDEDRKWLGTTGFRLLLPLTSGEGELVGVLGVGPARSGVRYSEADLKVASAFSAAAGLAFENLERSGGTSNSGAPRPEELPAGECGRCGKVVERAEGACSCGEELTSAVVPVVLNGKFRIECVLGRGGMGVVYRATDLALGRTVALKTLPRLDLDALQRLQREARSMASVIHPNLATIYGVETWRGVPILVVEYLAGGTLAQRISGPMEPKAAVGIAIEIATALEAMHAKGLLHRDLKPSNIGFADDGRCKLLDFGLARLLEEAGEVTELSARAWSPRRREDLLRLTATNHVVGTPLYLSPEALAGAPPSKQQDLWALFIVLWEMLAGRHPLSGRPVWEAMHALARAEIPGLLEFVPTCPRELTEVLANNIQRGASYRQKSASAARHELEGVSAAVRDRALVRSPL